MIDRPVDVELLDDPGANPAAVRAELRDIAWANRWLGGTRAVVTALEPLFAREARTGSSRRWTLLDVGTGAGDIPAALRAVARRHHIDLVPIGLERIPAAARLARERGVHTMVADGDALPFRDRTVDVVIASQVLHHLPRRTAVRWIAAFDRLARRAVVIADLYRSRFAMAGVWLGATVLGKSRTSRHDAVVSLRRGYTLRDLERLLDAAGVRAAVRRRRWSRLVAMWTPEA